MAVFDGIKKRFPTSQSLPSLKSLQSGSARDPTGKLTSRLAFLQKRIRLRGNSKISVPLYLVLLFPLILLVVLLIILINPNSAAGGLIATGAPPAIRKINEQYDKVFVTGCADPVVNAKGPRANATFVVLARNQELDGVIESIKSVERHFNRFFKYPYTFLNDGEFNSTFKDTVRKYVSSPVEFGKIGPDHWGYPNWTDANVAKEGIRKQGDQAIMYGGMESYHHMCRFYSGFFWKHELLQKYEWYWRVEPEIKYFCDMTYDPFVYMEQNNKTYGFTIAVKELRETVPNIFRYASAYMRKNKIKSQGLWEMFVEPKEGFNQDGTPKAKSKEEEEKAKEEASKGPERRKLSSDGVLEETVLKDISPEDMEGQDYNMCHFWSNFEIARLSWFRSKEYEDFFQMMDRSGGFWMERWGDAPIHSLAAGALLSRTQVHYFRDYGYRHTTIQHCPANAPARQLPHIPFYETTTEDAKLRKEEDDYWAKPDRPQENGVGCRCRCDTDIVEVETKEGSCIPQWVDVMGGYLTPEGPN